MEVEGEVACYTYSATYQSCAGHFTQCVWDYSRVIGCGVARTCAGSWTRLLFAITGVEVITMVNICTILVVDQLLQVVCQTELRIFRVDYVQVSSSFFVFFEASNKLVHI